MKMWILTGEAITNVKSHVQGQYSDVAYDELVSLNHPMITRLVQVDMPEYDFTQENMVGNLYVNPQTNEVWYEYTIRPLTAEELKDQRIANLEIAIANILGV